MLAQIGWNNERANLFVDELDQFRVSLSLSCLIFVLEADSKSMQIHYDHFMASEVEKFTDLIENLVHCDVGAKDVMIYPESFRALLYFTVADSQIKVSNSMHQLIENGLILIHLIFVYHIEGRLIEHLRIGSGIVRSWYHELGQRP